jgi:hypothetical protein
VLAAPDADGRFDWLRRLPLLAPGRLGEPRFAMLHAAVHPDWGLEELVRRARRVEARLAATARAEALALLAADARDDEDRDLLARLTQCRSVTPAGRWSPEPPAGARVAWHAQWSSRAHDYAVVYGHWSLQGLNVAPGLRGLDTGCVHHGRGRDGALTAWLPDPARTRPFDVPDARFWQVPAQRVYYDVDSGT